MNEMRHFHFYASMAFIVRLLTKYTWKPLKILFIVEKSKYLEVTTESSTVCLNH